MFDSPFYNSPPPSYYQSTTMPFIITQPNPLCSIQVVSDSNDPHHFRSDSSVNFEFQSRSNFGLNKMAASFGASAEKVKSVSGTTAPFFGFSSPLGQASNCQQTLSAMGSFPSVFFTTPAFGSNPSNSINPYNHAFLPTPLQQPYSCSLHPNPTSNPIQHPFNSDSGFDPPPPWSDSAVTTAAPLQSSAISQNPQIQLLSSTTMDPYPYHHQQIQQNAPPSPPPLHHNQFPPPVRSHFPPPHLLPPGSPTAYSHPPPPDQWGNASWPRHQGLDYSGRNDPYNNKEDWAPAAPSAATPAFGQSSTPAFGSTPAFCSTPAFGSTQFGTQTTGVGGNMFYSSGSMFSTSNPTGFGQTTYTHGAGSYTTGYNAEDETIKAKASDITPYGSTTSSIYEQEVSYSYSSAPGHQDSMHQTRSSHVPMPAHFPVIQESFHSQTLPPPMAASEQPHLSTQGTAGFMPDVCDRPLDFLSTHKPEYEARQNADFAPMSSSVHTWPNQIPLGPAAPFDLAYVPQASIPMHVPDFQSSMPPVSAASSFVLNVDPSVKFLAIGLTKEVFVDEMYVFGEMSMRYGVTWSTFVVYIFDPGGMFVAISIFDATNQHLYYNIEANTNALQQRIARIYSCSCFYNRPWGQGRF